MNVKFAELKENELPKYDMEDNPTGCCPRFNPDGWDDRVVRFRDKLFVKAKTKSFLYVPINMGRVFKQTFEAIEKSAAMDCEQFVVLSRDLSFWSAEHLFSVTKDVPGEEMVRLSGNYVTKVFEGPYRDAGKWCQELEQISGGDPNNPVERFFFYTTCPKCAKFYGKNYVVGLAGTGEPVGVLLSVI